MSQVALDVSKIEPMNEVEREVYDPYKLKRLREDIKRHGIHNAIHVIKKPKSRDKYEAFIGIHRLKCAKVLTEKNKQYSYVPTIVENISREDAIAKGFRDNNLQEPVNPMDTARTIKILKRHGLNYEKTAKMLFGSEKHLSLVKQYARLLYLPLPVQNRVKEGRIPWSNAILFVKLMDKDKMTEACEFCVMHNLGRNEIKERIRSGDFGETNRKAEGNPTRCFACGEMTSYKKSRSKQICLDCLKKIGNSTVNPLTVIKSRRKATVNPLTELSKEAQLKELRRLFKEAGKSKKVNPLTDLPEVHAYWDDGEEGFRSNVGSEEERKFVYEPRGIVEFLEEKGIPHSDQIIEGWTPMHQKEWEKRRMFPDYELSKDRKFFKELSDENIKRLEKKHKVKLTDKRMQYCIEYAKQEDLTLEETIEKLSESRRSRRRRRRLI